ncbi:MAG TPA: phosphatase PAP2 family protein [Candidatus Dormibacteraeota bacterium]|jgi:undecaprenyl-diphosphatase|nr:phosphatase PAP2 family protein [Candidatus Dormibacteraeota bacterium]
MADTTGADPRPERQAEAAVSGAATRVAEKVVGENAPAPLREEVRRVGGLRALDAALVVAVNRLPHTEASDRNVALLSDLGRGIGWAAVCAGLWWRGGGRGGRVDRRREVVFRTLAALLVANTLAQGPLKRAFRRRRPFHDVRDHIVVGVRTPDTSFPSGHSAGSFAAASSLALAYPAYAPPLLAVAAGVGVSRVYLGHHYPSDVLAGAAVGVTVGALAAKLG